MTLPPPLLSIAPTKQWACCSPSEQQSHRSVCKYECDAKIMTENNHIPLYRRKSDVCTWPGVDVDVYETVLKSPNLPLNSLLLVETAVTRGLLRRFSQLCASSFDDVTYGAHCRWQSVVDSVPWTLRPLIVLRLHPNDSLLLLDIAQFPVPTFDIKHVALSNCTSEHSGLF